MDIINKIKTDFYKNTDLIVRSYKISFNRTINLVFLETVASNDKINDLVLKNLVNIINLKNNIKRLNELVAGSNCVKLSNYDEIEYYLTNGYVLIIDKKTILAVEARLNVFRSISSPQVQSSINGSKDAFVENYLMNVGLIKRRIKSKHLKNETIMVGSLTNTYVGVYYIDNVVDSLLVKQTVEKLKRINIDGVIDSSEIGHFLSENNQIFPTVKLTERPDAVSKALLNGKIAIVVDNSPFVLITPSFFIDFIHPDTDGYTKSVNVNFIKSLRLIAFFITTMVPGLYIAIVNYNQEAIPTNLLLNFAAQREGLPFPAFFEACLILLLSEILRESDLRFPSNYGSSISILGALVLGEAAVSAGIVSPIMIIVISLSYISSLMFTDIDMINATRYYRLIFLVISAFLGIYGWILIIFLLLFDLCSTTSLNKIYTAPVAPYDKAYFKSVFLRSPESKLYQRSNQLVKNNRTRKI